MGTRVVFDKRTLRKKYGAAFEAAIRDYRAGGCFLDEIAQELGGDPSPLSGDEPVQVSTAATLMALACAVYHGGGIARGGCGGGSGYRMPVCSRSWQAMRVLPAVRGAVGAPGCCIIGLGRGQV